MSSLGDNIKAQYEGRESKNHLYDTEYSRRVDEELLSKLREVAKLYFSPTTSILEIGAGSGGNVNLFKQCGVTEDRICLNELLENRAKVIRSNFPNLKLYEGDAAEIDFERTFDCVFQSTVFTSILSQESRGALASKMWRLLNPGGIILWYDFIYNNPSNKNVRKVTAAEATALFPEAKKANIQKITLAPPIGRRVGKLYGALNWPILRSHILAVFQK